MGRKKKEEQIEEIKVEPKKKVKKEVTGETINKPKVKEGSHKDQFLQLIKEMGVEFVEDGFSNEIMFKHDKTGIEAEKKQNIVVFCFDYEGNFRYLG